MGKDQDVELVHLAQSGNARAFEALVVKYQRRIARHVARYIRRASDVEDVVQETFIRAYRGLSAFRGDSTFYSWLYRIATNAAINALERDPAPVLLGDDAPEERADAFQPGVSDNEDPERRLMASQIADAVQRAIERLQPELANALMLYEVEGKPYSEIANMLGIPIGTVRTRIFRAREFIAKRLEPVLGPQRSRRW
jgi:RNA polymerase sigma-70 factor, ECF subfamily